MIDSILPRCISVESIFDLASADSLLQQEAEVIRKAVPKRAIEFTAGRHCARRALARLGIANFPILAGSRREPIWPAKIVGSITHCTGFAAAAVACNTEIFAIGIDAEVAAPLSPGLIESIASPAEQQALLAFSDDMPWDRVIFSAKEAFYKAWYPVTKSWLEFHDVDVTFRPDHGIFSVNVKIPHRQMFRNLVGRFLVADGIIFTAVYLPCLSSPESNN